jgi:hypothetical protein
MKMNNMIALDIQYLHSFIKNQRIFSIENAKSSELGHSGWNGGAFTSIIRSGHLGWSCYGLYESVETFLISRSENGEN